MTASEPLAISSGGSSSQKRTGALSCVSGNPTNNNVISSGVVGLTEVPAWTRDMDDNEAFMQLVLGNTQGELSPLEIGMHALKAVPLAQGKTGSGLKAYAERLQRTGEYIGQLRSAASVIYSLPNLSLEVADKARQLYEISRAPREAWPALVESLVKRGWTVGDTKASVTGGGHAKRRASTRYSKRSARTTPK